MATYTFDKVSKIIEVNLPDTEVTIQELVDAIRTWEDDVANMEIYKVCDASGKEGLGGGVLVGITLTLIDWKIKFADRPGPTWVLCRITGGNLVCWDTTAEDYVDPISPAAYVTVSITASSSATLQELAAIQYSSFNGGVTVDLVNGSAGTTFPVGTPQEPVNNLSDAKSIAVERGFDKIYVIGDLVIQTGTEVNGYEFEGQNHRKSHFFIEASAATSGCEFTHATVSGTLDGNTCLDHCEVHHLNYIEGYIRNSVLVDEITLAGTTNTILINCIDGSPGQDYYPRINFNGAGQGLIASQYCGELFLMNKTGPEPVNLDFTAGHLAINSDVTAGNIYVRGIGDVEDWSTGTTAVHLEGMINRTTIADAIWDEELRLHTNAGSMADAIHRIPKDTGRTYYVHGVSGLDNKSGRAPGDAFQTIGKAIQRADPGDTIRVAAGLYTENDLTINNNYVKLIFDHGALVSGTLSDALTLVGDDCHITRGEFAAGNGHNAIVSYGDCTHIESTTVTDCASGITCYGNRATLDSVRLYGFKHTGVSLRENVSSATIYDCNMVGDDSAVCGVCTCSGVQHTHIKESLVSHCDVGYNFKEYTSHNVIDGSHASPDCTYGKIDNGTQNSWINFDTVETEVWDAQLSDHLEAGSMGEALDNAGGSGESPAAIADAVWDELAADHTTSGTMGASVGLSAATIANAVWNQALSNHTTSGTAGAALRFINDIEGGRWKIDTTTNTMNFYADDNVTIVASFDLYDQNGVAASDDVYERRRT